MMKWPTIKWPKMPTPPSFRATRWINLAMGLVIIALSALGGPSWVGMINMACAGFLIGGFLWTGRIIAMQENFDKLSEAFHAMSDLNRQLIAGKMKIIIEGGDADAPERPARLH